MRRRAGSSGSIHPLGSVSHPQSEGQQLQQHLHGEEPSEDHVEDVHDVAEGLGLLVVLRQKNHSGSGVIRQERVGFFGAVPT